MSERAKHTKSPLNLDKVESYYHLVRHDVINPLFQLDIQAKRVLEIGCSAGATGKHLKEKMGIEHYVGIEMFEEAAQLARAVLDEVHIADIEKTSFSDLGFREEDFDLLVALDVLEHLYDPWEILVSMSLLVKSGGYVVLSIPNAQNISVIANLAHGQWKYESAGLLDVTHIRFFTLTEIQELVTGAGLEVAHININFNPSINISEVQENDNSFNFGKLTMSNLTKEEIFRLFAYQYIIIARKL
ncbi:class I SAM-dependent methyltransferase [Anthocerotibacter panamensis]|uniref:class I SAM-dependent methyltransferase n=1 Tax=Anthocerotibacter panamensis TaxID=2857077 RepID=UPI001C40659B|nr:class I SAM-dependent methyltransferase [Anthocerotibacter panamensis]